MMFKTTLDSDFNDQMQPYLLQQEGIEWKGSPKRTLTITCLEWGGVSVHLCFFFAIVGYFSYDCYLVENYRESILWASIPLVIIMLTEWHKYLRRTKTKYAFSKNRIQFQIWRWGRTKTYYIYFTELRKITYQEFSNKNGTIFFMPKRSFNFKTHDFIGGKRQFYPTFESIPNVKDLCEKLSIFHQKSQVFED